MLYGSGGANWEEFLCGPWKIGSGPWTCVSLCRPVIATWLNLKLLSHSPVPIHLLYVVTSLSYWQMDPVKDNVSILVSRKEPVFCQPRITRVSYRVEKICQIYLAFQIIQSILAFQLISHKNLCHLITSYINLTVWSYFNKCWYRKLFWSSQGDLLLDL